VAQVVRAVGISVLPNVPVLGTPADGATTDGLPTLSGTFDDPDVGDTGKVKFRLCTASDCSDAGDPVASGYSATGLAIGTLGSWSPSTSLATGSYYWQAKNLDALSGYSAWSESRAITIDATPPDTSITSAGPSDPTNAAGASFSFSSSEPGSSFECKLDAGSYGGCTSPEPYSGLAEGSHTFQVHAIDALGNVDGTPDSRTWVVDTAPPDTSVDSGLSNPTNATGASLSFSSEAGATFECRLDGGSYGACTSPKSYSGLADGSHTFDVRATDLAGNLDPSAASFSWTVDTLAPGIPRAFHGAVSSSALRLFWAAPVGGAPASYVLYVNGAPTTTIPAAATSILVGAFSPSDTRTFALSAVDAAGNEGLPTGTLVGVPAVRGLWISAARTSLSGRGLALGARRTVLTHTVTGRVVGQSPGAGALLPLGGSVGISVSQRRIEILSGARRRCDVGGVLGTRVHLASPRSKLTVRFYLRGRHVFTQRLGTFHAQTRTFWLRLPWWPPNGATYRLKWTARAPSGAASSWTTAVLVRGSIVPRICGP
jgi:hypothetical protein